MVRILIDILYALGLLAFSPVWLYRMIRHGRYREDIGQRLGKAPVRHGLQPVIWVHAVSLGEINATRTLVDELAGQMPDCQAVISTTTETGMAQARKLFAPDRVVFRFPLDFSLAVRRAFGRLRPSLVVLMEGEVWPNFLAEANRRGVPVVLVNGRISENKGYPRYRRVRPLVRRLLFGRLTALAVQERAYADRFVELGADPARVRVTGTMKFDTAQVADTVDGADALAAALDIRPGRPLIVAGGTGDGEERILLDVFAAMRKAGQILPAAKLALVPRKPERFGEVARLIRECGFPLVRRSERPDGIAGPVDPQAVILGDTMGELRKFYALASVVFVGRSLVPLGGSDMIEAAALGRPTAFGPHTFNFPQAHILTDAGAARRVADAGELGQVFAAWLAEPAVAAEIGRKAQEVIREQQGATRRNVAMICEVLGRTPAERPGNIATKKLVPQATPPCNCGQTK